MPSLVGSGEEDFSNFVNVFLLFCNYLPLEMAGALESPSLKDALCQLSCNWLSGSGEEYFLIL